MNSECEARHTLALTALSLASGSPRSDTSCRRMGPPSGAIARSNSAVNLGWWMVGLYRRATMRSVIHFFGLLSDSGSAGAVTPGFSPFGQTRDSAAAANQASYSTFASTTETLRFPCACSARASSAGPSSAGQSRSASSSTSTRPSFPPFSAARRTRFSSSPGLTTILRGARIGRRTSTCAVGETAPAIRVTKVRMAAASPWPSTMGTMVGLGVGVVTRPLAVGETAPDVGGVGNAAMPGPC